MSGTTIKILAIVVVIALALILGPYIVGIVWAWVVNDVFAGAVAQNILPGSLTWFQALKLELLLWFLALTRTGSSGKK